MSQIDRQLLASFLQEDEDLLAELAVIFVKQLADCEARLRLAIVDRDASGLRDTAHLLKSRLAYFQAGILSEMAATLEQRGKEVDFGGVERMLDDLVAGMQEMLHELRQMTGLQLVVEDDD